MVVIKSLDRWNRSARNLENKKRSKKAKLSRNKSWKISVGMECRASIFTLTFGTTRTTQLSALRAGRPPRKLLGTHFCSRVSGPLGY